MTRLGSILCLTILLLPALAHPAATESRTRCRQIGHGIIICCTRLPSGERVCCYRYPNGTVYCPNAPEDTP